MRTLRVLVVADFSRSNFGANYYNSFFALANGFVRANCHVLTFSDRDTAREAGILRHKVFGRRAMNNALIAHARTYRPHLIVFGHVDMTTGATIEAIREALPTVRMIQFHLDALFRERAMQNFSDRAAHLDLSFITTADKDKLARLSPRPGSIAYAPNPVDASIATANVAEMSRDEVPYDAIFLGSGPERREQQVRELQDAFADRVRFFAGGSIFGTPRLKGPEFLETLATATMSPSLPIDESRPIDFLYASDRIAQLFTQGLVPFCQEGAGLDQIYEDGIVTYSTIADLADKIIALTNDDARRQQVARKGWRIGRERTSAEKVAQYMIDLSLGYGPTRDYGWPSSRSERPILRLAKERPFHRE